MSFHHWGRPARRMDAVYRTDTNYLLLVDYTRRLFREEKATISREVAEILGRIGSSAEGWQARLEQLKRRGGRLLGRFFAVTRERLRTVAK